MLNINGFGERLQRSAQSAIARAQEAMKRAAAEAAARKAAAEAAAKAAAAAAAKAAQAAAKAAASADRPATARAAAPHQPAPGQSSSAQAPFAQAPSSQASGHRADSAQDAARSGAGRARHEFDDALKGTLDGMDMSRGIRELNGKGDSVTSRATLEGKALVDRKLAAVGGKGQLGSRLTVTRDSDAPDSTYTVRLDKHTLAAATGELDPTSLGKGKGAQAAKGPLEAKLKAEAGVQTFDAVEMTFANQQDAVRATQVLNRLRLADAANDAGGAMSLLSPVPGMGGAGGATLSGGGGNVLANPMNSDGAPGALTRKLAGVSDDDLGFLRSNVSAYEQTLGTRVRLAGEGKLALDKVAGAVEGRLDGTPRTTRRVELPTDTKDGTVTYTTLYQGRVSTKEKMNNAQKLGGVFEVAAQNRSEWLTQEVSASVSYAIPRGTDPTRSGGGRPVPELDALSGSTAMPVKDITLQSRTRWRDEPAADRSRADFNELTTQMRLNSPERIGAAAQALLDGRGHDAADAAGAEMTATLRSFRATGTDSQPAAKLDLAVAKIEGSLVLEMGVNDLVGERSITVRPGEKGTDPVTETRTVPAPADDGMTVRVLPREGVNLRDAPGGDRAAIIQNGSFLRRTGETRAGADGQEWMQVAGTDKDDAQVRGWVRSDLVTAHDASAGAMNDTGRVSPRLDHQRYRTIHVVKDDNLWNLAHEHGLDHKQLVDLNKDHLANPSLIFAGDTVYIPDTAQGPRKETVQVAPGTPGTGSVETRSQGENRVDGTSANPLTGSSPVGPASAGPAGSAAQQGSRSGLSGDGAAPVPTPAAANAPSGPQTGDLDRILRTHQAKDDTMTEFRPELGPIPVPVPFVSGRQMTRTEADLLHKLGREQGAFGQARFKENVDHARAVANERFPTTDAQGNPIAGEDDGHNDAFRHTYWNALMTRHQGEDFATRFGTAHEGVPGNAAAREAMDLYNNSVGRRIARENPNASDGELADLVKSAVDRGDTLVIDRSGQLARSNGIGAGGTGMARGDFVLPGVITVAVN